METEKSKSERKRDMLALQKLAIAISKLSEGLIAQIPLPEAITKEILAYKKMTAHGALRRQAQFLGKLMRDIDCDPIRTAYENMQLQFQHQAQAFHHIEVWRDRLLSDDKSALTEFIDCYPSVSVQELRQLIIKSKKTATQKELFRFLRQQMEP